MKSVALKSTIFATIIYLLTLNNLAKTQELIEALFSFNFLIINSSFDSLFIIC